MLERIAEDVRRDLDSRKVTILRAVRGLERRSLVRAIEGAPNVPLIAEIKWASPSAGPIRQREDPRGIVLKMVNGGAISISVLTEHRYFGGSPELLEEVRGSVQVPLLYKNVVVDERQVHEAASLGADAVLLMVSVLKERTGRFVELVQEFGMEALVEIQEKEEIRAALDSGADLIGINNRDMRTMRVSLERTVEMARYVPEDAVLVSESGITNPSDVRKVMDAGADAVLVGTSIMKADNIEEKVRSLVMAGVRK